MDRSPVFPSEPTPEPGPVTGVVPTALEIELSSLLNRHSQENASNTPDFVLAQFLLASLAAFNASVVRREQWYGRAGNPARGTDDLPF